MLRLPTFRLLTARLLASALLPLVLAACGGGSGGGSAAVATTPVTSFNLNAEPNAPLATNDTASDGFNWFNYRRQQIGISTLARNSFVEAAALGHSNYQKANDTITHTQTLGKPGFTGVTELDRLKAAGYNFTSTSYAYGEVISSMTDVSGFNAAEDLITAIYHRFVVFEPMFKEAGAGASTVLKGYTYFTADMLANNLDRGLGRGKSVVYPFDGQKNIITVFNSDYESPDPVPNRNAVGFPVSIHADLTSTIKVSSFTITPRGGAVLTTIMLTNALDPQTPTSAAAIIPLEVLAAQTVYDVRFVGSVDGTAVDRSWSFTTR
jgi:uncharacterized protein YkwD